MVDLESPGYPSMELAHVMDIHDSPVTCLKHVSDPNTDLIPGLYKVSVVKSQHDEVGKKVRAARCIQALRVVVGDFNSNQTSTSGIKTPILPTYCHSDFYSS